MQTPYPSVHFPLLLVCRPRSLEEKTRMPASPAKRSCGASSPEAQRGTVCEAALGTFGMAWTWGQNSCLWPTCLSVLQ